MHRNFLSSVFTSTTNQYRCMDGDDDDFKIKRAATKQKHQHAPETCTICLEAITERAVAVPCNHLTFDFLCLVSWLQEQSSCPLCKAQVTEVQYDWRSPEDYKRYHVPAPEEKRSNGAIQQRRRRRPPQPPPPTPIDPSLEHRRHIYTQRLYALHIGSNPHSQYRDFTPTSFASSPVLQSRAKAFLRRELQVFAFLSSSNRDRDFLIEYIVAILRNHDIRGADGKAEELLRGFLGWENARQLVHELGAWLRSPFERLGEWDEKVQYREVGGREKRG